jgi:hypothetical protein
LKDIVLQVASLLKVHKSLKESGAPARPLVLKGGAEFLPHLECRGGPGDVGEDGLLHPEEQLFAGVLVPPKLAARPVPLVDLRQLGVEDVVVVPEMDLHQHLPGGPILLSLQFLEGRRPG